jgi:hypothetical protein
LNPIGASENCGPAAPVNEVINASVIGALEAALEGWTKNTDSETNVMAHAATANASNRPLRLIM